MANIIDTVNNSNNRKKKNQTNITGEQGAVAQKQANTPMVQSLAQKSNFGISGAYQPQITAPSKSEQRWADRQERFLGNETLNRMMPSAPKPLQYSNIDGLAEGGNDMIRSLVNMKNQYRMDSYNQANQKAMLDMYGNEAKLHNQDTLNETRIHNQDTSNTTSMVNSAMKQTNKADTALSDMTKRSKLFDSLIVGIDGYDKIKDTDLLKVKARYIQTGEMPTKIDYSDGGYFGFESSTPQYSTDNSYATNPDNNASSQYDYSNAEFYDENHYPLQK